MVKHYLTVCAVSECGIEALSDRAPPIFVELERVDPRCDARDTAISFLLRSKSSCPQIFARRLQTVDSFRDALRNSSGANRHIASRRREEVRSAAIDLVDKHIVLIPSRALPRPNGVRFRRNDATPDNMSSSSCATMRARFPSVMQCYDALLLRRRRPRTVSPTSAVPNRSRAGGNGTGFGGGGGSC